jgi:NAD(P)-dependent dehydrogenase (short-subunit alcohol dehydrogenase family)
MARVFITGSSEGLGLMAARLLVERGHEVTLHARNDARAADARRAYLASLAETRRLADQVNKAGRYDAVIHNAGVGYQERYGKTIDGLSHVFQINVLAPYLLTALVTPPERLIYLSSGMHMGGRA